MSNSTTFNEAINGHNVFAGLRFEQGASMNNYYGAVPQDRKIEPNEPFSTIPFAPDPEFVNRVEILEWVRNKCARPGARAALVGLGGVGKSQLAIQYAHDFFRTQPRPYVFWVHGSTRPRFEQAYKNIARRLELPGHNQPNVDVLRLVCNWLEDERNHRWMVVLDNVDDTDTFFPSSPQGDPSPQQQHQTPLSLATYLPRSSNGSILVTSRNNEAAARLVGGHKNIKQVTTMDEDQSLQLLRTKLSDEKLTGAHLDEMVELVHNLDCVPLAISQAAAYINRQALTSIPDFIQSFLSSKEEREKLLHHEADDLRRDGAASNSVMTTWQMSFEKIQQEKRTATELLSLLSFFNPQGIPEWVLRRSAAVEKTLDEDLNTLHAYSIISIEADGTMCGMHPLVQFCTQAWLMSTGDIAYWSDTFREIMAEHFPFGKIENWTMYEQLFPHIEPLLNAELVSEKAMETQAHLLGNVSWYLFTVGKYHAAKKTARKLCAIRARVLGSENPVTIDSVYVLCLILNALHDKAEAEELARQALQGFEKELGVQHPQTLKCRGLLGRVMVSQKKFEDAETLFRRLLEDERNYRGHLNPYTMTSLGVVLHSLGQQEEAETLTRQALEAFEKELGELNQETIWCKYILANIMSGGGKHTDAKLLLRQVLEKQEEALGERHPLTLNSIWSLARILRDLKEYSESAELYERAYSGYVETYGSELLDPILCGNELSQLKLYMQSATATREKKRGISFTRIKHRFTLKKEKEKQVG